MNKLPPLTIGGIRIKRGETRDLRLRISESYTGAPLTVPVRVIRSENPGPRLFLTAAIHGDELNGTGIIRELFFHESEPLRLQRGSLICVPVVNVPGFEHHSRYLPDRRDLNRCFPGSAKGSQSSGLAHTLFTEIVSQCHYGIDFHSAAVRRTNFPNIRADLSHPESRRLARAFGWSLIVDKAGPEGSMRRAAVDHGVATIILEAGEVWKIEPGVIELGTQGILNVLRNLKMIEGEKPAPSYQTIITETTWVRSPTGGLLIFHAKAGEIVEKGRPLATVVGVFGSERRIVSSPIDGIVLGMCTMPAVKPGDPVYHLAVPTDAMKVVRRHFEEKQDRDSLYRRLQRQLATNVLLRDPPEITDEDQHASPELTEE